MSSDRPAAPGAGWPAEPPPPPPRPLPPGWPEPHPPGDWSAPGWSPPRRNGPSVAALFLGLLALPATLFVLPGLLLGPAAVVLGVIGRRRVHRGEADTDGVALAGIVLGGIAIATTLAWGTIIHFAERRNQADYEQCLLSGERPSVCVEEYEPTDP